MTDPATDQTNRNSRSTATVEAGATFVDAAESERELPPGYHPEKEHTIEEELAELAKMFPQVAELLRTSVRFFA